LTRVSVEVADSSTPTTGALPAASVTATWPSVAESAGGVDSTVGGVSAEQSLVAQAPSAAAELDSGLGLALSPPDDPQELMARAVTGTAIREINQRLVMATP